MGTMQSFKKLCALNVKKIKSAAHKNGFVDGTCKRALILLTKFNFVNKTFVVCRVKIDHAIS